MKIKLTSVHVDDQEKALRFYTDVSPCLRQAKRVLLYSQAVQTLHHGLPKKADFSQGSYRWLTVASAEDPDGTELQLALNGNPAAKAYQQAMFQQGHREAAVTFSLRDPSW